MNSRILDSRSLQLTVYQVKNVLQAYGSIHQDLTSYTAGFSYLLEIMKNHFSSELNYLRKNDLTDPHRQTSVEGMQTSIKEKYQEIRIELQSLKQLTLDYSDEKQNDDYFHFLQFQKQIEKKIPQDISIDPFIRMAHSPPSDYATKVKTSLQRLQERNAQLKPFLTDKTGYHDFIVELMHLNSLKEGLLHTLYKYAAFRRSQEQKRAFTSVEFQAIFSHTSHECTDQEIQTLRNVLSRSLHFTSADYYLLLELVWNGIAQLPSPNLFWEYIDLSLKRQAISFADKEQALYVLSLLVEPLTVATAYQKVQFSGDNPSSYEKTMRQLITEVSGSSEIQKMVNGFITLLTILRLYSSLKRSLFSEQMRSHQDRFEAKWFSMVSLSSLEEYCSLLGMTSSQMTYGAFYKRILQHCTETIDQLEQLVHR